MSFLRIALALVLLILPSTGANGQSAGLSDVDTLVVCPEVFQTTLRPWIDYRRKQGHLIQVIVPPDSAAALSARIKLEATKSNLKSVLLVGDAGTEIFQVPVDYQKAKVNIFFGSEPDIATDNTFADLNGDQIPELAIGRLPVDTNEELSSMIDRIIAYENSADFSDWRRRINVVAGVGGFDPMTDKIIEQSTSRLINHHIPQGYPFSMTYGSWSSPYCPAPEKFGETSIDKFNEGCLFWVYVGHGSRHRLDSVFTPKGRYEILNEKNVKQLECRAGNPIAIMLCCYSGAFDDPVDCLAENMLVQPKGPISVLCGNRVTMPYAMSLLSLELMDEHFQGESNTLGQLMLRAKQRLVDPQQSRTSTQEMRDEIEKIGSLFNPKPELVQDEIYEHLALFQLLGDPLLRIARPEEISLKAKLEEGLSTTLEIAGQMPFDGELMLEVCYARNRFRERPMFRNESKLKKDSNEAMHDDYLKHQNTVCTKRVDLVKAGEFIARLELPVDASGELTVRGFLRSQESHAIGAQTILLR
jgi:Peptidase family C25